MGLGCPVGVGSWAVPLSRPEVAGHVASAVSAIAANGSACPVPRCGIVRYSAPASAETLSRPSVDARCGSRCPAIPVAATVVAVPEPKPPAIAPMTTSGTKDVAAAALYPSAASSRPALARVRGPTRSTRPHEGEARRGRTHQQRTADEARLRRGEMEAVAEAAHDGGQQIRGQITGREESDKGPGVRRDTGVPRRGGVRGSGHAELRGCLNRQGDWGCAGARDTRGRGQFVSSAGRVKTAGPV